MAVPLYNIIVNMSCHSHDLSFITWSDVWRNERYSWTGDRDIAAGSRRGWYLSIPVAYYICDVSQGIRFRGYSIPELQKLLPKGSGGEEPLPEGIFFLMLTGQIPTQSQVQGDIVG